MNVDFYEDLPETDLDFDLDLGSEPDRFEGKQHARRKIERHLELKRLRELLGDYDLDRDLE